MILTVQIQICFPIPLKSQTNQDIVNTKYIVIYQFILLLDFLLRTCPSPKELIAAINSTWFTMIKFLFWIKVFKNTKPYGRWLLLCSSSEMYLEGVVV